MVPFKPDELPVYNDENFVESRDNSSKIANKVAYMLIFSSCTMDVSDQLSPHA